MCETPFDPIGFGYLCLSIVNWYLIDNYLAQKKEVRKFAEYLNWDGLLILRMVDLQCGVIFGTDLVGNFNYKIR